MTLCYSLPVYRQICNSILRKFDLLSVSTDLSSLLNINTFNEQFKKRQERRQHVLNTPLSQRWYREKQQNLTKNQKLTLRTYWNQFGIDFYYNQTLSFASIFPDFESTTSKVHLDIGFGDGQSIIEYAKYYPNDYFVGCEIHKASLANTLQKIVANNLTNIKLIRSDVNRLLKSHMPIDSIDRITLFFPDPWPNEQRDGQRRIIGYENLNLFRNVLKVNSSIVIATDVMDYANHVMKVFNESNQILESSSLMNDNNLHINQKGKWILKTYYEHLARDRLNDINLKVDKLWKPITNYEEKAALKNQSTIIRNFEYILNTKT